MYNIFVYTKIFLYTKIIAKKNYFFQSLLKIYEKKINCVTNGKFMLQFAFFHKRRNMPHQPTLRVLKVLEFLAGCKQACTLSAMAKNLQIPPSTLLPILQTLQEKNYIKCEHTNKSYELDFKIVELAQSIKKEASVLEVIRIHMKKIRNLSAQTCQLGILKGGEVLYLEKFDAKNEVRLKSFIGTTYPAYATSLGKALLEKKSKKDLQKLYPNNFEKITKNTLKNIDELYSQLKHIRKEKIAIESGEMNPQIECMAIGIEYKGKIIAAISISYLVFYSNEEFRDKNKKILLNEKKAIEDLLAIQFPNLEYIH